MPETQEKPIDGQKLRAGIESIFAAMMQESHAKARQKLAAKADDPEIVKASKALAEYDYEAFSYGYLIPFEDQTRAMVASTLNNENGLQFLFANCDFISAHLTSLFTRFEGHAYCVDKTRTIMRSLARFYHRGEPIQFDYQAQYAYWLPTRILRDHDSIVAYFLSLQRLHGGHPDDYIRQFAEIAGIGASKVAD